MTASRFSRQIAILLTLGCGLFFLLQGCAGHWFRGGMMVPGGNQVLSIRFLPDEEGELTLTNKGPAKAEVHVYQMMDEGPEPPQPLEVGEDIVIQVRGIQRVEISSPPDQPAHIGIFFETASLDGLFYTMSHGIKKREW